MTLAYESVVKVSAARNRVVQDAVLEGMTILFKEVGQSDLELDDIESATIGLISILLDQTNPIEKSRTDAVIVASTLALRAPKEGKLRAIVVQKLTGLRHEERAPAVLSSLDHAIHALSSS